MYGRPPPRASLPCLSMDSLVANYASSDDDEEEQGGAEGDEQATDVSASAVKFLRLPPSKAPSSSSVFSSSLPPPELAFVPPPFSSSSVSSLPPSRSLPSDLVSSHLGEVDDEAEKGTPSSTYFKAPSFKAPRSVFSALPPPKLPSSSFPSSSLLRLVEEDDHEEEKRGTPSSTPFASRNLKFSALPLPKNSSSSSLFSTIPPPKSENLGPEKSMNHQNPNRGVQFTLPPNPSVLNSGQFDDDEEDEDVKGRSKVKDYSSSVPKASSSASFSWLPAPKNTFGLVPSSGSASSRRSIVDADVSADNSGGFASVHESSSLGSGDYQAYNGGWSAAPTENANDETTYMSIPSNGAVGLDQTGAEGTAYSGFDGNVATSYWDPSYEGATEYGSYQGNWSECTAPVTSDVPDMGKIAGKRGRHEIPMEILEVKQDELMKNRPRQDQTKMTGIAFGPSYQPTTSSSKGKPTKLHKRKHQIGSLYFDMRQKEMELAERRSRGLLTKAETQAKYGW